ncbi:pol polyprotein [Trichonephila clavata]|uniref:Pol polyprotein n=1 Tax=Trichonephila clavata TaxID=2740835 RepID=A0A8X6FCY2_TRICU|nr:pol polyprotein [Trichonephila clavata]
MDSSPIQLVENLKSHFNSIRPSPATSCSKRSVFVHPALKDCCRVFIRNDTLRKSLQAPYDGTFRVLYRTDKTFDVDINGRKSTISIDRGNHAFLESDSVQPPVVTETVQSDKSCTPVIRETKQGMEELCTGESAVHAPIACTSNLARSKTLYLGKYKLIRSKLVKYFLLLLLASSFD